MEYPILYQGREVGRLTAAQDGLYWQLTAWCESFAQGVQRLYGAMEFSARPFGVLAPAGSGLSLHRRISRHTCPKLPELWTAGRELQGFRPWRGSLEGQRIDDALLAQTPEGCMLALPGDGEALPLAEYAPQMQPLTLGSREYLTLELRNGLPVTADQACDRPEQPEISN